VRNLKRWGEDWSSMFPNIEESREIGIGAWDTCQGVAV